MKKIILAAFTLVSSLVALAYDPGVDEKVLEAFNKTFKNVEDVVWSTSGDNYQVKFTQHDISSRVYYDREGNILKTFRYYKEDNLPILVLTKVKSKYNDKSIFGVTEISSEAGTFYHITLEDKTHWMQVRADSYGSLKVEKKFRKG